MEQVNVAIEIVGRMINSHCIKIVKRVVVVKIVRKANLILLGSMVILDNFINLTIPLFIFYFIVL